jgi:hypothetical protein
MLLERFPMPSKSDIHFGKIVVTNKFANKEEVEEALRLQYRFEKKRSITAVIEPFLLHVTSLEVSHVKAIQEKIHRRVIFCEGCRSKFNISQFAGGERFLCHKCGRRVEVPDSEGYFKWLVDFREQVEAFVKDEETLDAASPTLPMLEEEVSTSDKQTVMITREEIESVQDEDQTPMEGLNVADLKEEEASGKARTMKAEAVKDDAIELEDIDELEVDSAPEAPPAEQPPVVEEVVEESPAKKSPKDVAREIMRKKKKKKKKKAPEGGAKAERPKKEKKPKEKAGPKASEEASEIELAYAREGDTLTVTGGSEKAFLSHAPPLFEDLFSGKRCTIVLSAYGGLTRDGIKKIRTVYKESKSKGKVTLEISKEQAKLAGSMTKKMFSIKMV